MRFGLKQLNDDKIHRFTAEYSCHRHYYLKDKMILLLNVRYKQNIIAKHIWIKNTKSIQKQELANGQTISFSARVQLYVRKGPKVKVGEQLDYGLVSIQRIQKEIIKTEEQTMNNNKYITVTYKNNLTKQDLLFDFHNKEVWLTQKQIAEISQISKNAVSYRFKKYEEHKSYNLETSKKKILSNGRMILHYGLKYICFIKQEYESFRLNALINWCIAVFNMNEQRNNKLIDFSENNSSLELKSTNDYENLWLNIDEIAELFDITKNDASNFIRNAITQNELSTNSNVKLFTIIGKDNNQKEVEYYSLKVVLAVGFQIKNKKGIALRKWGINVLFDYLIKGYALNLLRLNLINKTVEIKIKKEWN